MNAQQDPFDEWLKDRLEASDPAFQPAYWEQAAALLDQHLPAPEKKRRRFIFWLWFLLPLAIAGDMLLRPAGHLLADKAIPVLVPQPAAPVVRTQAASTTPKAEPTRQEKALGAFSQTNTPARSGRKPRGGTSVTPSEAVALTRGAHDAVSSNETPPTAETADADRAATQKQGKGPASSRVLPAIDSVSGQFVPVSHRLNHTPVLTGKGKLPGRWAIGGGLAAYRTGLGTPAGEGSALSALSSSWAFPLVYVRYEPRSPFAVQAGVSYLRENVAGPSRSFVKTAFGLGFNSDSAVVTPTALHSVRVPVRIERNILPRQALAVGMEAVWHTGAWGATRTWRVNNAGVDYRGETEDWLPGETYHRLGLNLSASYLFYLHPHARLGASAHWGLTPRWQQAFWNDPLAAKQFRGVSVFWEMDLIRIK